MIRTVAMSMATLCACLLAAQADAAQRVHTAKAGETLEQIAEQYYGDSAFASALREHNALGKSPLEAGRVVLLPVADSHTVVVGDTWDSLSGKYWQEPNLGAVLSRLVLPPDAGLEPGTVLSIPARAHHQIQAGENLARLSRRTYDGPDRALDIAALNRLKNPHQMSISQRILIPLFGLPEAIAPQAAAPDDPTSVAVPSEATATPLEPVAAAPVAPADPVTATPDPAFTSRVASDPIVAAPADRGPAFTSLVAPDPIVAAPADRGPAFTPILTSAVDAYYRGDFGFARDVLERARPSVLEHGARQEQELLLHHLVLIYAAYDEPAALCETYLGLKSLAPATEYDPRMVSPKVRKLTAGCN